MASSVKVNGGLIRQIRESKGIERDELAEMIGVGQYQIYVIERRRQSTRPRTLRMIAQALDVSPEDLTLEVVVG